jgi:hypothetical protein
MGVVGRGAGDVDADPVALGGGDVEGGDETSHPFDRVVRLLTADPPRAVRGER